MSGKKDSKSSDASLAKQLIAGIAKHYATATSVTVLGQTMTPAQLTTTLQSLVTLRTDAETAHVAAATKVATENAQAPAIHTLLGGFVAVVRATWGNQPDVLADFGIPPRKARTPLTSEQKAAAAAKRKATRAARNTQGPKQKAGVKGNVTGIVITPITAPAPAQPLPTAATAPANAGSTSSTSNASGPSTPHA